VPLLSRLRGGSAPKFAAAVTQTLLIGVGMGPRPASGRRAARSVRFRTLGAIVRSHPGRWACRPVAHQKKERLLGIGIRIA
jgi:hypothetical protein